MNTENALEYKCPSCSATLRYDAATGDMVCDYCGSRFTAEQMAQAQGGETAGETQEEHLSWKDYEKKTDTGDYTMFVCPACGAEIVTDATTAATECVYCGNNAVMQQRLDGIYRPDYVLPFTVTKEQAETALLNHYKGKKLLPKAFLSGNRVEKITGMYVPYWLYDCDATGSMSFSGQKTERWSDARYDYRKISDFNIVRGGSAHFEKIPVDGSSRLPSEITEAIEPYDYSALVPYSSAYLSGFFADRYDVEAEGNDARAAERVRNTMESEYRRTISNFESVSLRSSGLSVGSGEIHYALLPVWLLNTVWNGETYTFAMNGQTGRFIGDLPVDKGLYWRNFFLTFGICAAVGIAAVLLLL